MKVKLPGSSGQYKAVWLMFALPGLSRYSRWQKKPKPNKIKNKNPKTKQTKNPTKNSNSLQVTLYRYTPFGLSESTLTFADLSFGGNY